MPEKGSVGDGVEGLLASQLHFNCLQNQGRLMTKGMEGEAALGDGNSPERPEERGRVQSQGDPVLPLPAL